MSLRLFESNLANVPPELRPHYIADVEHGYRLDVSDLPAYERGLRNALAVERATVRKQKAEITELRSESRVVSLGGE